MHALISAISQSVRKSFSGCKASNEDTERFIEASGLSLVAAVVILLLAFVMAAISDEENVQIAWTALTMARAGQAVLACIFVVIAFLPWALNRFGALTNRRGTLCNLGSFSFPALVLFLLTYWSGGLGSSVFAATFTSVFGISLLVPKDKTIQVILLGFCLGLGVALVLDASGSQRRHDGLVLGSSLVSYLVARIVKWVLDTMSGKFEKQ